MSEKRFCPRVIPYPLNGVLIASFLLRYSDQQNVVEHCVLIVLSGSFKVPYGTSRNVLIFDFNLYVVA